MGGQWVRTSNCREQWVRMGYYRQTVCENGWVRMDETAGGDCVRSVAAATVIYWHQLKCQNLPNIGPDLISGESRETEKQGGGE